ncbi:LOW QUALITY PROTEIN: hypothetical protein YC2023_050089 [Brassica napus]
MSNRSPVVLSKALLVCMRQMSRRFTTRKQPYSDGHSDGKRNPRNIPRKFRGNLCSSEKTDEFRGNTIAVGEPLGDFTKFRGNSDELAFSVGIPSEFPRIFMAEKQFEYRYATEDKLEEMKQREFTGWMFTYVCYIKYPRVRNRDDPWVTVTRLNPRGRVQGTGRPTTTKHGNLSTAEDLAGVGLVVDLTDFGEEAVVHVEDEPVIGEFHQDPDSDSSGDDDSETDYH